MRSAVVSWFPLSALSPAICDEEGGLLDTLPSGIIKHEEDNTARVLLSSVSWIIYSCVASRY